jgi:hypothetical protein
MPLQDFLTGALLFALMLLATGAATGLIVRARLAHLDRLERALAALVTGTAILTLIHLVPLALGVLDRASVLIAAAVAVALATRVRPAGPRPQAAEDRGPRPPSGGPFEWVVAGAAAAVVAVAALADLGRWAGDELVGVDPLTFHLPNIGRWIQSGSLWQIDQFVPQLAHGNYPNNGDVVMLSTVLPWHNDFLVRAPIVFFLIVTAAAVAALARELRAPIPAAVLAGAAVVSIPIVGIATIPRALPDSLLWATFACGALFLLRHARTGRRSDLMLAATALAIAFGTKWYGISSVGVLVAAWTAARLLRRDPHALRHGLLVGGLALLGDAAWLARNLVESANPVFPVKIAPFGVTIFDAPRDEIVEAVGFSILDYVGDPPVLGQLAGEVYDGLGLLAIACAVALVAAAILSRRAPDPRVALLAGAAIALTPVYMWLPGTALGNPGDPSLASVNTRYAVPILMLLAAVAAWTIGRLPRLLSRALQLALLAAVVTGAYKGYEVMGARDVVLATLALALLGAAGWLLWRTRANRPVLVAAAALAALVTLAAAHRVEERINDGRYLGADPAIDALLKAAPSDERIGLASDWSLEGLTPIWPSFGTRIENHVEYVGYFDGFLRRYPTKTRFQDALRRGRYDLLVVGRGFEPPQPTREQQWAIDAGWRTIALSTRLRVLAHPRARRLARGRALLGTERERRAQRLRQSVGGAGRREEPPWREHTFGQADLVARDDEQPDRHRLLDDDRHRVAIAVGGDDARHREHVGVLHRGQHLRRRRAAEQLDGRAGRRDALGERVAQRAVAEDPHLQDLVAEHGCRVDEHLEALLLDESADREHDPPAAQRRRAPERLRVDAHHDLVNVGRRHELAQVHHVVVTAGEHGRRALELLA